MKSRALQALLSRREVLLSRHANRSEKGEDFLNTSVSKQQNNITKALIPLHQKYGDHDSEPNLKANIHCQNWMAEEYNLLGISAMI